jgi:hypothetical protein
MNLTHTFLPLKHLALKTTIYIFKYVANLKNMGRPLLLAGGGGGAPHAGGGGGATHRLYG